MSTPAPGWTNSGNQLPLSCHDPLKFPVHVCVAADASPPPNKAASAAADRIIPLAARDADVTTEVRMTGSTPRRNVVERIMSVLHLVESNAREIESWWQTWEKDLTNRQEAQACTPVSATG